MMKSAFNGRDPVFIMSQEFISERATAETLGVNLMRLRRSAVLHMELRGTTIAGHPYYMKSEVERIANVLSGYILRADLKRKPKTKADRIKAQECIVFGLVCYPRKCAVDKSPQSHQKNIKNVRILP
ncbi:MAG TPA: hypothetical protein PL124_03040 [Candidatus Cloacimonadota bacterium]|nr:hypothetical protein [Candidatus Cloacimonadota bacterium]HPS38368.1 hypothetical protein [Candidatus Cloacimonadota bacterium]